MFGWRDAEYHKESLAGKAFAAAVEDVRATVSRLAHAGGGHVGGVGMKEEVC